MKVKTILKSNALKAKILKNLAKTQKQSTIKPEKENYRFPQNVKKCVFNHPATSFLRGSSPNFAQFKKFVSTLYKGLFYSINNLKGPSQAFINKKKVKLLESGDSKKKILLMDLDETLIHSVFTFEKTDVKFVFQGEQFKFNVRPNCFQFLESMNNHFHIYVFTAGTQDYAEPIVSYLNRKKRTIQGILHRRNCMETHNGFFIKDLRIIQNRQLQDIIIVDNLVHSFGLQITNGIPILQFLNNKADRQLLGLQQLLIYLSTVPDVRESIKQILQLQKCLQIDQQQFLNIQEPTRV